MTTKYLQYVFTNCIRQRKIIHCLLLDTHGAARHEKRYTHVLKNCYLNDTNIYITTHTIFRNAGDV